MRGTASSWSQGCVLGRTVWKKWPRGRVDGAQEAAGIWLLCGRQWGLTVALGQEEARRINTEGCPHRRAAWEGGGRGLGVMPDTRGGGW